MTKIWRLMNVYDMGLSRFYGNRVASAPCEEAPRLRDLKLLHEMAATAPESKRTLLLRLADLAGRPGFEDFLRRFG